MAIMKIRPFIWLFQLLLLLAIGGRTLALSSSTSKGIASPNTASTSPNWITAQHVHTIARGGVVVLPNFLSTDLIQRMRRDAKTLFQNGYFVPDGLTNTALKKEDQGFQATADRQTFRGGDGWFDASAGDLSTRTEFDSLMLKLRNDLSLQLNRPTLASGAPHNKKHEMTYNWYQPGASLGRHLDEHHEETKGNKGWLLPTRRSVTWLVYLNDAWQPEEGGSLQTFPRQPLAQFPVGAHEGNLQVGWMDQVHPVFLDAWRPSGGTALYMLDDHNQPIYISQHDFDVPRQPIEFEQLLSKVYSGRFEQISTARLDPRFVNKDNHNQPISPNNKEDEPFALNILPTGGTLVMFDSVSLPHLVQAVTGNRPRIAATGWFHEDNSQFPAERIS